MHRPITCIIPWGVYLQRSHPYRYVIFDHESKFNIDVIQVANVDRFTTEAHEHPGTELQNAGLDRERYRFRTFRSGSILLQTSL
jgi:hypothetical protein